MGNGRNKASYYQQMVDYIDPPSFLPSFLLFSFFRRPVARPLLSPRGHPPSARLYPPQASSSSSSSSSSRCQLLRAIRCALLINFCRRWMERHDALCFRYLLSIVRSSSFFLLSRRRLQAYPVFEEDFSRDG